MMVHKNLVTLSIFIILNVLELIITLKNTFAQHQILQTHKKLSLLYTDEIDCDHANYSDPHHLKRGLAHFYVSGYTEIVRSLKRIRLDSILGYSQNFLKMNLLDQANPENDFKIL